jgi:hypothetical protein
MSYPAAVPPAGSRISLYAGASRASRTLLIVVGVLTCLWILGLGAVSGSVAGYFAGWLVGIVLIAAVGFPMAIRSGAWLEGTTLVVRGAVTSRRCDLAAGSVHLAEDRKTGLPVLTAQDPTGGQRVSVLLREPKEKTATLVSPPKLHALAGAIMARGRADAAREQVAGQLAWLAENWPGSRAPQLR